MQIPEGYKEVNTRPMIKAHCSDYPKMIKNINKKIYAIFCPKCGLLIEGNSQLEALDKYQGDIR